MFFVWVLVVWRLWRRSGSVKGVVNGVYRSSSFSGMDLVVIVKNLKIRQKKLLFYVEQSQLNIDD